MYNYLFSLVNSYKKNGFDYYLIYYSDLEKNDSNGFATEITKSYITCYFAKSPILQNADYSFTVEDEAVIVNLDYDIITTGVIKRQDTSLLVNEFEEVIVPNNSYIFTNAEIQTTSGLAVNIYPSFYFKDDLNLKTNLDFTNFVLVLLFVTIFIVLLFRKFIFGG